MAPRKKKTETTAPATEVHPYDPMGIGAQRHADRVAKYAGVPTRLGGEGALPAWKSRSGC